MLDGPLAGLVIPGQTLTTPDRDQAGRTLAFYQKVEADGDFMREAVTGFRFRPLNAVLHLPNSSLQGVRPMTDSSLLRQPGKNDRTARQLFGPAYDAIPKSVFACIAWHLANINSAGADTPGEAELRFIEEWNVLVDNGIVPQPLPARIDRQLRARAVAAIAGGNVVAEQQSNR